MNPHPLNSFAVIIVATTMLIVCRGIWSLLSWLTGLCANHWASRRREGRP